MTLAFSAFWPVEDTGLWEGWFLLLLNKAPAGSELLIQGMAEFGRAANDRLVDNVLNSLAGRGLVRRLPGDARRRGARYQISDAGRAELHGYVKSLTQLHGVLDDFLTRWRLAG